MSTIRQSQFSDSENDTPQATHESPSATRDHVGNDDHDNHDEQSDTASQRSASPSSPARSPQQPTNGGSALNREPARTTSHSSEASMSLLAAAGLDSDDIPSPSQPDSSPHLALFAAAGLGDAPEQQTYPPSTESSPRNSLAASADLHGLDDPRQAFAMSSPTSSPRQAFAERGLSDSASEHSIPRASGDLSPRQSLHASSPTAPVFGHSIPLSSPDTSPRRNFAALEDSDSASARSIVLSSPPQSHRGSILATVSPLGSPEQKLRPGASTDATGYESARSFAPPSIYEPPLPHENNSAYPPRPHKVTREESRQSVFSTASGSSYSKKARPESMLMGPKGPLVLGIALVDFNHLVGPKIEFYEGSVFEDDEVQKMLPFLALPDGAHLSSEDYSYFHLVPNSPNPTTVFGISCNRQIRSADLLVKDADVTRSTVQKAVVVLASIPVFGIIRDRLGVVTRALFDQRDFTNKDVLIDFHESLEIGLRSQLTESGLYMGTSLRQLVHTFRHRTLVLVKALILQKRIMFSGHPVERLCTHQYSLISLIPGLLQTLEDCGSPPLASRAPTLSRPSSLKTSDRRSMMAYVGLPLDVFGKDAFFQPYLPLQQLDMMKETQSWLCGSTNSIVSQSPEVDLLVNLETGTFEYRNPSVERSTGLTAADRKWIDEIVQDVNDGWTDDEPAQLHFRGSDDYVRVKFDEYISAALASVKYADFIAKGEGQGVVITDGPDPNSIQDFNPLWVAEFKRTNAYEVWNRITDPVLFDLVEPRHPCGEKPSVVADIGLRLAEGIQELKLDQQLAPAREAVSSALSAGSTSFFKAVEGVRGRWAQRQTPAPPAPAPAPGSGSQSRSSTPVEVSRSEVDAATRSNEPTAPVQRNSLRPLSLIADKSPVLPPEPNPPTGGWGTGIGSFLSTRWGASRATQPAAAPTAPVAKTIKEEDGLPSDWKPRNLDEEQARHDVK